MLKNTLYYHYVENSRVYFFQVYLMNISEAKKF